MENVRQIVLIENDDIYKEIEYYVYIGGYGDDRVEIKFRGTLIGIAEDFVNNTVQWFNMDWIDHWVGPNPDIVEDMTNYMALEAKRKLELMYEKSRLLFEEDYNYISF